MAGKRQAVRSNQRQTNQRQTGTNSQGFFAAHYYHARAAFYALWQRPMGNILTLAVISIALTLPACLYLLGKNVAEVSHKVMAPVQISAYLDSGVSDVRAMVLKDALESRDDVIGVEYISSQQGLADLSQYSGFEQALSLLDEQALPAVLIVEPQTTGVNAQADVAAWLAEQPNVSDVRLDSDWLARLGAIKQLAVIVASALAVLMLSAVFLIVGNTLRFNVLANKEEIQTMKLIGATDHYILRPYVYTGMWFGLLGALVAWLATALLTVVVSFGVEQVAALYDRPFRLLGLGWDESLLLMMVGIAIGSLAARISAQRHLNEIEPI
ncbi:cell division protein FtsX [Vibrio sp. SM6]|uniref:Cell division protein FtsX n=1 Tax=Vibrio agarilyticus TaxID=2726741 RepID=A0A7X8TRV5_9VIBR|nr:permease-like cell division protein FtsX [Vibrio agarilyticus]NLS13634.1 cell division protein FtsX [Vibrio agarilyticus]